MLVMVEHRLSRIELPIQSKHSSSFIVVFWDKCKG